mmetsp:Transcript_16491/g.46499  ORF Transcript_16491/g.46499 Transcript_16491/m.46499 type:complete len:371 (+) Transcript_16491:74-1186(+)
MERFVLLVVLVVPLVAAESNPPNQLRTHVQGNDVPGNRPADLSPVDFTAEWAARPAPRPPHAKHGLVWVHVPKSYGSSICEMAARSAAVTVVLGGTNCQSRLLPGVWWHTSRKGAEGASAPYVRTCGDFQRLLGLPDRSDFIMVERTVPAYCARGLYYATLLGEPVRRAVHQVYSYLLSRARFMPGRPLNASSLSRYVRAWTAATERLDDILATCTPDDCWAAAEREAVALAAVGLPVVAADLLQLNSFTSNYAGRLLSAGVRFHDRHELLVPGASVRYSIVAAILANFTVVLTDKQVLTTTGQCVLQRLFGDDSTLRHVTKPPVVYHLTLSERRYLEEFIARRSPVDLAVYASARDGHFPMLQECRLVA